MHLECDCGIEADLIDRLCKRDPEALAAIYDRYARFLYSLLLRITRDRMLAEDLMQEVFLRLWNRAPQFDSNKGTLGVWLLSIARNIALDQVRSSSAQFAKRLHQVEHWEKLDGSTACGESESLMNHILTVKTALSNLNSHEKQVLELAYFDGYSQSEIATLLQKPLGTVKSCMRSALMHLRSSSILCSSNSQVSVQR
jgi:RNA polymerase sigma-70 factor (ECF subfamily)